MLKVQDYISETEIVLKKHKEYEIMKHPKWYFIELPKFRKKKPDVENRLEQWLLFIDDCNKEGIEMAENKNQTLKEARGVMNYLTGDAEVRRLAELRERWAYDRARDLKLADQKGIKKGEKRGKKEGMKEAQLEIAKKLLKMGKDMDEIMLITSLSVKEINNLKCFI